MTDFSWQQIQSLPCGTAVSHWSALKGRLNGKFTVRDFTDSSVVVETGPGTIRRITRSDFENVARLWSEYKEGRLSRHDLSEVTVNSTYIVSLLHLLEHEE